jgi:hypothetical protein
VSTSNDGDNSVETAVATDELFAMSRELGEILKSFSDRDPFGAPTESAAKVFSGWVAEAGPVSKRPGHFADVFDNFNPQEHTNRDLFDLFNILESYIEYPEPEMPEPKTFIGLPVL